MIKTQEREEVAPITERSVPHRVWMPVGLLLVVFAGTLVAYHNLVGPAPEREETARATEPASAAGPVTTMPPMSTFLPIAPTLPVGPLSDATPAPVEAAAIKGDSERPGPSHQAAAAPARAKAAQSLENTDQAVTVPRPRPRHEPASPAQLAGTGVTDTRPSEISVPAAADPRTAEAFRARDELASTLPLSKVDVQSDTASARDARRVAAARLEISSAAMDERPARIARKEESAAAPLLEQNHASLPPVQHQHASAPSRWLTRLRGELESCGGPGRWRSDMCRESARWTHCHPNRWNTVPECSVSRMASSAVAN